MSTPPTPIPTTPTNPISVFIKAHERLFILILCLLAGWYFYGKAVSAWEAHDQRADNLAHATLAANITTANQIATINAKEASDYQAMAIQLAASNKALAASQSARNTATQTQQTIDRTLPPYDLANRWTTLLKIPPESVQIESGGKGVPDALIITPAGATETVVQLENIPTLQADLKDEQTVAANEATQITSLAEVNGGLNKQIDALIVENTAEIKACTDDKKLLTAKARKSKLHWFEAGVVVGFIGRQIIKTYSGF
jgi:hypothetical protein